MKKALLYFVLLTFASCISITGLTNDYHKLPVELKKKITTFSAIDSLKKGEIYKITGNQLFNEVKKHPKAFVYEFTNSCVSNTCYPLVLFENYANTNGFKLFVVMNGYARLSDTLDQEINAPLFAINNEYYKRKFRISYTTLFLRDLLQNEANAKNVIKQNNGNIYLFENGVLIDIKDDLKMM